MNSLLLFAKFPEPGRVKTRLAETIGTQAACDLYRQILERVIQQVHPAHKDYATQLCFDPPDKGAEFRSLFPTISQQHPQKGANLGARLENAIRAALDQGSKRVIVIGSDCPSVDRALIVEAFEKLDSFDLVLGPAADGGYYLIGCKKLVPELFDGIPWSTPEVLGETLKKAKDLGLSVHQLKTLTDIDDEKDLQTNSAKFLKFP